jgi:Spy/CpxP family protein refolding chaperone
MKFIPAFVMALSLCAVGTSACAAQQQPSNAEGARRAGMGGLILQGITLTEAQKTQQKAIREKYAPQLQQIRKTSQTTGTPMDQAKLAEIRSAQLNELRAILTAEQQVIFDRNVAEMRARRAESPAAEK